MKAQPQKIHDHITAHEAAREDVDRCTAQLERARQAVVQKAHAAKLTAERIARELNTLYKTDGADPAQRAKLCSAVADLARQAQYIGPREQFTAARREIEERERVYNEAVDAVDVAEAELEDAEERLAELESSRKHATRTDVSTLAAQLSEAVEQHARLAGLLESTTAELEALQADTEAEVLLAKLEAAAAVAEDGGKPVAPADLAKAKKAVSAKRDQIAHLEARQRGLAGLAAEAAPAVESLREQLRVVEHDLHKTKMRETEAELVAAVHALDVAAVSVNEARADATRSAPPDSAYDRLDLKVRGWTLYSGHATPELAVVKVSGL